MSEQHFKKNGRINLNGPHVTGYAVKTVIDGYEVLVLATDPGVASGVAAYLNEEVTGVSHVVLGQKPWYQSEHRDHDLDDMFPDPKPQDGPRRRGLLLE